METELRPIHMMELMFNEVQKKGLNAYISYVPAKKKFRSRVWRYGKHGKCPEYGYSMGNTMHEAFKKAFEKAMEEENE